jgi:hypothetical protein
LAQCLLYDDHADVEHHDRRVALTPGW